MSQETKVRIAADIVFLIGVNGSMQPCIDALRDSIRGFIETLSSKDAKDNMGFIETLSSKGAKSGSLVMDWRARVVGYRDFPPDGEARWLVDNEFVRDACALGGQLSRLVAEGGGDEPESLLDALYLVSKAPETERGAPEDPRKWRRRGSAARIVVVFTNVGFHPMVSTPGPARGGNTYDVIHVMLDQRIRLKMFCPALPCFEELGMMPGSVVHQFPPDGPARGEALADIAKNREIWEAIADSIVNSFFIS